MSAVNNVARRKYANICEATPELHACGKGHEATCELLRQKAYFQKLSNRLKSQLVIRNVQKNVAPTSLNNFAAVDPLHGGPSTT